MKKTKERGPSHRVLVARAKAQVSRVLDDQVVEQLSQAKDRVGNLEKQRDTLASQLDDGDRRFRALLWALELAHKENRELRARLEFLQSGPKRDSLALAS